jgi:ABC-2 type transport system permease protein
MKKYLEVFKATWEEYMVYRLNFALWRLRTVLRLFIVFFLWSVIFTGRNEIFGYNEAKIITYILGTSIVASFVLSSRTIDVGGEINEGRLTNYLLKPMSYFHFWFAKDIADKLFNIMFSVVEITLLIVIFKPPIFIQPASFLTLLALLAVSISIVMYFFINLLLGFIAFVSPDTWPPRFIFIVITDFLAGGLFPLDILPKPLFTILNLTPFPYLLFFPLKIYTGGISQSNLIIGFITLLLWTLVLAKVVDVVWRRGLRVYSSEGR